MPDYSKGVIYKITTPNGLYVGSSCNFKEREYEHTKRLKNYNLKLYQNIRENGGIWKMEKIKDFPCNSRRELLMEEDRIMLELNADLNAKRAYMTEEEEKEQKKAKSKEYREANKEQISKHKKQYREANKEQISKKKKEHRHANIEQFKEKEKKYYQANKEQIIKQKSEVVECECGSKICRGEIARHTSTKRSIKIMKINNNKIIMNIYR